MIAVQSGQVRDPVARLKVDAKGNVVAYQLTATRHIPKGSEVTASFVPIAVIMTVTVLYSCNH